MKIVTCGTCLIVQVSRKKEEIVSNILFDLTRIRTRTLSGNLLLFYPLIGGTKVRSSKGDDSLIVDSTIL
ncbi:hypothetical protein BpHYR1_009638 [Brachionus plicatilis]|uniref:Uncharacterized protein n=1 Tax=Brachionus plicatilis TaxID=10195 RepID=A0A3M7SYI7_BRAPC|nr:hypothetical protein BpHYR1_009638 [Brachionus plicatilis]